MITKKFISFDEFSIEHSNEAGGNEELLHEMFDAYIKRTVFKVTPQTELDLLADKFKKINVIVGSHFFELADDVTYNAIESELSDIGVYAACVRNNSPDIIIYFSIGRNLYTLRLDSQSHSIYTQSL